MLLRHYLINLTLSVLAAGSTFAFPKGATLPVPELVRTSRFSLVQTKLSNDIQVVVFYYSASWCTPCKQTSAALRQAYPDMIKKAAGLEFITYTIDQSPRARADYLRDTRFDWPALSPEVIDEAPWLKKIPGGTPQFQAFEIQDSFLVAITETGDSEEVFSEAFKYTNPKLSLPIYKPNKVGINDSRSYNFYP